MKNYINFSKFIVDNSLMKEQRFCVYFQSAQNNLHMIAIYMRFLSMQIIFMSTYTHDMGQLTWFNSGMTKHRTDAQALASRNRQSQGCHCGTYDISGILVGEISSFLSLSQPRSNIPPSSLARTCFAAGHTMTGISRRTYVGFPIINLGLALTNP